MTDDLAQELVKAQAAERMAQSDYVQAHTALRIAREKVREITAEIGRRCRDG